MHVALDGFAIVYLTIFPIVFVISLTTENNIAMDILTHNPFFTFFIFILGPL